MYKYLHLVALLISIFPRSVGAYKMTRLGKFLLNGLCINKDLIQQRRSWEPQRVAVYVAMTLLSWSRVVSETCPTPVSFVFLRICHVFTCRAHINVAMSVQHRPQLITCSHVYKDEGLGFLTNSLSCFSNNLRERN